LSLSVTVTRSALHVT